MRTAKTKSPSIGTYVDDEEKALAKLVESDGFKPKSLLTSSRRKSYTGAAQAAMNEGRVKISLRIAESDLLRLKAKAMRESMLYQTLIGSILHKAIK